MRRTMLIALTFVAISLLGAASAEAVVIDMGASGRYGVALVPGTRSTLTAPGTGITTPPAGAPCSDPWDPWLASDFSLQNSGGLCYHGGPVMHANETFAVTWDPHRLDWQTSRNYVEQYLKDVADGGGAPSGSPTLTSPYALTSQYHDAGGPARYKALYGGGCIDFGQPGGSSCKFKSAVATGPGHNDISRIDPGRRDGSDCPTGSGMNYFWQDPSGLWGPKLNDWCITDDQIRTEVLQMVSDMGLDTAAHLQSGYTPLIVLRTPPGVVDCLDKLGKVCSANGVSTVQFCSYHAQASVGGTMVSYVVQPWTALTSCDDPGVPPWNPDVSAHELAIEAAERLVSPISQGQLAAITDPALNAWYRLDGSVFDGSEINDNGCIGFPKSLDQVTVGASGQNPYFLQREFNNGGAIASDPNAPKCAPSVDLAPTFVVPSPIDAGDIVAFDGSVTDSTLLISQADYTWNFGDGTSRHGASVVHQFAKGGVYTVKLTVTDRGGYGQSVSHQVTIRGSGGQVPPPPVGPHSKSKLKARLALIPQGFGTVLRSGIAMRVTSNEPAAGLTRIWISKRDAKRAHFRTGRSATVVIGRGTVSGIKNGTVKMRLRLSRDTTKKLGRLRHLKLTVRLSLTGASDDHATIDAAGSY